MRLPTDGMGNLALSCPGCNLAKADRTSGVTSDGAIQPLFNPRAFEPWLLGWHLHFAFDRKSGTIVPRTPTGEASVRTLNMNDALRVFARQPENRTTYFVNFFSQ